MNSSPATAAPPSPPLRQRPWMTDRRVHSAHSLCNQQKDAQNVPFCHPVCLVERDSDMVPSTTLSLYMNSPVTEDMGSLTSLPPQADTTIIQVVTTAAPSSPDSAVIAVVVVLILLTLAALGFLLYRYLCHNKGDYRTTGEPAPGEDPDDEYNNQAASEKKEYFI